MRSNNVLRQSVLVLLGLAISSLAGFHADAADKKIIEDKAMITDDLKGNAKVLAGLVELVRLQGYRCDTISAARPMMLSRGFVLVCNNFSYEYEIEDRGGNWQVKLN